MKPSSRARIYTGNSRAPRKLASCTSYSSWCTQSANRYPFFSLNLLCSLASDRLKLEAIHRFTSTATAVEDITAMQKGKLEKGLKRFLTEEVVEKGKGKESLVVVDTKLSTNFLSFFRLTHIDIFSLFCRSVNCQEALNQDG